MVRSKTKLVAIKNVAFYRKGTQYSLMNQPLRYLRDIREQ